MPQWMLSCSSCQQQFPHSEIPKEKASPLSGPFGFLIEKPLFPEHGLELECPNCGETSVYQRHQLTLRAD
jgi:predicted RNA-binding Zn-ribbon protein involved in translation (DUF1610 family)